MEHEYLYQNQKLVGKEKLQQKEDMEEESEHQFVGEDKKKRSGDGVKKGGNNNIIGGGGGGGGGGCGSGSSIGRCCQAERCTADLNDAKQYHKRHKVCEYHAKAQVVVVAGVGQRFCQQCSRFHELSEFDEAKRSCRRRLAGHNERRRKSSSDSHGEGSGGGSSSSRKGIPGSGQLKELVCGKVEDIHRGRIQMSENSTTFKHFQIR